MKLNILNLFNSCCQSTLKKIILKGEKKLKKRKCINNGLLNFNEFEYYETNELSAFYNAICNIIDAPAKPNTNSCFDFDKKDIFSRLKKEIEFYASSRGYAVQNDFIVSKHCLENDTL